MNIDEKIQNLVSAGFNKSEIIANLQSQGYTTTEIEAATKDMGTIPSLENIDIDAQKSETNIKMILVGILFLGIGIARLAALQNDSGLGKFIGIIFIITGLIRIIMGATGKK